jgi:hypothetical protein
VFGDLDKGTGIELPLDELGIGPRPPARRALVGPTVAEAANLPEAGEPDVRRAPAPLPVWRRVLRWGLGEPRPSGT